MVVVGGCRDGGGGFTVDLRWWQLIFVVGVICRFMVVVVGVCFTKGLRWAASFHGL